MLVPHRCAPTFREGLAAWRAEVFLDPPKACAQPRPSSTFGGGDEGGFARICRAELPPVRPPSPPFAGGGDRGRLWLIKLARQISLALEGSIEFVQRWPLLPSWLAAIRPRDGSTAARSPGEPLVRIVRSKSGPREARLVRCGSTAHQRLAHVESCVGDDLF